ncbi:MAG: RNA methyltransferase [Bacteroidota bacterium]
MLSKTQSKYIRSLALQKFRKEHQSYLAEGEKIVAEWLFSDEKMELIVGLDNWISENTLLIQKHPEAICIGVSEDELKQISTLQSPNKALLVVRNKRQPQLNNINNWCIALDGIRDPGNMGTILRIADWFGIGDVICSQDCVDAFSPKVVQSGMGAHLRVNIHETNLADFIKESPLDGIAAVLGGENVYQMNTPPDKGIIIIGNEAKGISEEIIALAKYKVTIPKKGGAESLNAGVSTGILCALLLGK